MKKLILFSILISSFIVARAQDTSLHENFDVACATAAGFAVDWVSHTPVTGTYPLGAWHCGPTNGRDGTPGMLCTGYYSGVNHVDTAFLITPLLDFSHYTGSVYLRFDTKTTNVHSGGRFGVIVAKTPDSTISFPPDDTDLTPAMLPVISSGDSSGWVTHQVDLTYLKTAGTFYVAFRYISPSTSGNTWYLDNVNTSTTSIFLKVNNVNNTVLPLMVIGRSTSSQVVLSYDAPIPGTYDLAMFDMLGRRVYSETIEAKGGQVTKRLEGLNLMPGMYFIKMGAGQTYGTAKVVIQ